MIQAGVIDSISQFTINSSHVSMHPAILQTGLTEFFSYWGYPVMILIGLVLIYLGIAKDFEPLLLVPIGLGIVLINLPWPGEGLMSFKIWESAARIGPGTLVPYHEYLQTIADHPDWWSEPVGLFARLFHYGLEWDIIPPLVFLGLGAMTDFGPVIANPKTLLLGGGAQFGVYCAMLLALVIIPKVGLGGACSIGIIGGADGPTSIYTATKLAPGYLGPIAVASYSYMAMVPLIQPPIIRLLTSKKQRAFYMKPQLREVSQTEKIIFPLMAMIIIILVVPASAPLIGCFMFGNLLLSSNVTNRLANTAANSFIDSLTILLGITVGTQMSAWIFLKPTTLAIFGLGLVAFAFATAGGVILAHIVNLFSKQKINPMIGAAGVSAVPMSARVVQRMGQKANPRNFLLMHAMGPNVAGVLGTAVAAGVFISIVGPRMPI
ncbi:MAG: sodium ion-translocating decarboxylase subunit beta [Chloroflexi bacterium]|nr:sodium ion-translocating decarboxylase subunit beta [Chloroflexota bacterium]